MARKALFLDRDGVICKALNRYLIKWEEFEPMSGIVDLITSAKEKDYLVIVVTNQPQVSKKLLSEENLRQIHSRMNLLLGGKLDGIYYCPHTNADNCDCRKPKAGMLLHAKKDFDLDLSQSWIVGDSDKDILAGQASGCCAIFIKNEFNNEHLKKVNPDYVISNLTEAISLI